MMIKGLEKGTFYEIKIQSNVEVDDLPAIRETVDIAMMVGHRFVAFDLSKCTNMKSSFIGLVANVHKKCLSRNGLVAILNPSEQVARLVEASKLGLCIEVFRTENEMELACH